MPDSDALGEFLGNAAENLKETVKGWRRRLNDLFDEGFKPDEHITFYPSIGIRPETGDWRMEFRGRVYERGSLPLPTQVRAIAMALVPDMDALLDKIDDKTGLAIFKD